MLRLSGSVRARLIAGFSITSVLFIAACVICHIHVRRQPDTLERIRRLGEGVRSALQLASAARDVYAHQAHVIIDGLHHVAHYEEARAATDEWRQRVGEHVVGAEERESLQRIDATILEIEKNFRERLVPAAEAGRLDDVRRHHHEAERLVEAIVKENDRLIDRFRARIEDAQQSAVDDTRAVFRTSVALLIIAAIGSAIVGFLAARSVTAPVLRLVEATEAVASGDLSRRCEVVGNDELARLGESFNKMVVDLAERQRELVHAEKLASLGRLSAGVAHELNNPLGIILGYVKTLRAESPDAGAVPEEDLRAIEEEATQCHKIVQDLVAFASPVVRTEEACSLAEVIEEEAGRVEGLVPAGRAVPEVVLELAEPSPLVPVDRRHLKQLLSNLLQNAVDAMPEGGRVRVRARLDPAAAPPRVVLEVIDEGGGVPADDQPKVFEPFFTTKSRGTGLGLSICWGIVEAVGGRITIGSAGEGTTVTVELPAEAGEKS